jgi:hypothetical protein
MKSFDRTGWLAEVNCKYKFSGMKSMKKLPIFISNRRNVIIRSFYLSLKCVMYAVHSYFVIFFSLSFAIRKLTIFCYPYKNGTDERILEGINIPVWETGRVLNRPQSPIRTIGLFSTDSTISYFRESGNYINWRTRKLRWLLIFGLLL